MTKLVDSHVHLEQGPYSADWLRRFVERGAELGLGGIRFVEHTSRFREFKACYASAAAFSEYQRAWLEGDCTLSLAEYADFAAAMKRLEWPLDISFGLEVCYFPETEALIREGLSLHKWDFLIGSVHWVDGFGFDHRKELWDGADVDKTYLRYYEIIKLLIKSGMFGVLGHPDSIKCFGHLPSSALAEPLCKAYDEIAALLAAANMATEQNSGLFYRYKAEELGMNPALLAAFKKAGAEILRASDAHRPEDVGSFLDRL